MMQKCTRLVFMTAEIKKFLETATGVSVREMSRATGINHTKLGRQLNGDSELSARVVIAIAREYNINVLKALVVAGFITQDEAGNPSISDALGRATDFELAQQIMLRAANGTAGTELTDPLPPVKSLADHRDAKNVGGTTKNVVTPEMVQQSAAHETLAEDGAAKDS